MKKLHILLITILFSIPVSGQKIKEVSKDWVSFFQPIEIEVDSIKKFKVVAYVKVETNDKEARAGIWARVDNKPEEGRGFFDNMRDRPITENKWKSYSVEGVVDSKSKTLNFGAICYNNGKFLFDKFELYLEDDNGEFQSVEINNPSFESKFESTIPGWDQGISNGESYTVKEFKLANNEDAIDGNYSVLVTGSGIVKSSVNAQTLYPNVGILISIILILIIAFSVLANASSTSEEKWSNLGRIGFRFSFIYFFIFIVFHNNGAYPYFEFLFQKPIELMQNLTIWFGEKIVGIPYAISSRPTGSGDTTYDYLIVLIAFLIAMFGTLIWSILDRKRPNYKKMYYWLTVAMRYYVGLMLISYGLVKVIQLQFPAPGFNRLLEPYGESSPMGLAWTFLGFSEGYNMFMGIAEVLAGLLLFRRTLAFGAIITLMTTMNVMAVNYFFDVPVKLLSTHLVLMTLFLLSRDIKRIILFFLTSKPVEQLTVIKQPKLKKGLRISLNVFKGLIITYALGYGFYGVMQSKSLYGNDVPKPPMYGLYEVTNYVVNGDTLTNYKSDELWKNLRFEREGFVQIERMSKKRAYYKIEIDSTTQKIKFFTSRSGSEYYDFNYRKTDSTLNFNYIHKTDTVFGKTKRLDKNDFLLTNRGFRWISERPYNR